WWNLTLTVSPGDNLHRSYCFCILQSTTTTTEVHCAKLLQLLIKMAENDLPGNQADGDYSEGNVLLIA
ncbi:hypothetical protein C5167_020328, partial [Papaver somniferum]